ncbi:MAG: hypothetical protein V9E93_16530 [Steroidobacteraceae bacterium]
MKALKDEERGKFISEAMKNGDLKAIQSLLGAPPYLSGLTPQIQQHYTRLYREATAPAAVRKLNVTRRVLAVLAKAMPIAYEQTEKAMGGTFPQAARFRSANDDAMKALEFRARGLG